MTLEELKKELLFGDISTIARDCGYSSVTVHKALNGHIHTKGSDIILEYAKVLVRQQRERVNILKKIKDYDG